MNSVIKVGSMGRAFKGSGGAGGGGSPVALWAKGSPGRGTTKYNIKGPEVEGSGTSQEQ